MYCFNCGNAERFVLAIECTIEYRPPALFDPDWGIMAQCRDCWSDDVAGSPVAILAGRGQ